ncbi:hypothetical protein BANRA_03885 [Klebsiella quasipneumoniae]|nr:hypothetical protein BANRA_03885 [Klebsiella quasipneumoniae]
MLRTTLTSRSSACGRLNSILLVPSLGLAPAGPAQALFKIAPGNFVVSRIASGRPPWRPALVCRPPVRRFQRESAPLHARSFQRPYHSDQNISVKNCMCLSPWPRCVYRGCNDDRAIPSPLGESRGQGESAPLHARSFQGPYHSEQTCRPGKRSATGQGHRARRQSLARPVVNLFSLLAGMAAPKRARYFLSTVIMLTNG